MALAPSLSVLIFHTLRWRAKTPGEQTPRGFDVLVFYRSAVITKADGQQAFPSVTAQKTASFSLSFRPQSQSSEVIETIASHRLSVKEAAAMLSKEAANVGQQAALAGQDLCQLREELSKCSDALRNIFAGVIDERRAIQAAVQSLESISERRILIGLTATFVAGAASCGLALWIWRLVCEF
jgi:hypothetical protein